jgi:serine/threonine-protein kinase
MVGEVIENYKIVSILGEGGMGVVYKSFDLKLERFVALKILSEQAVKNPRFIERFKREARNQAKLNHPNIVPVYGFAEDKGLLGIVMEYVPGITLEQMIERKGKLEVLEAIDILKQVLSGIGYAHSKGFIHRDLKPSNIIINHSGVPKIMDFGISKSLNEVKGITKTGTKLGTVLYMSPEQIKAQEPTIQSDIYSLGITFYEMLCGKTPFEAPTDFHIMEAHLKKNPLKLSSQLDNIPASVDVVLSKALSKSTMRRFHTCEEFIVDLDSISLKPNKKPRRTKRITGQIKSKIKPKRFLRRLKIFTISVFALAALGTLGYFVYQQVSELLAPGGNKDSKLLDDGTNSYSSNPSYLDRSGWRLATCPVRTDLNGVTFINDSLGFACGTNAALIRTTDGGQKWSAIPFSDTSTTYFDVKFFNASTGIIAGGKGTILITYDSGKNWQHVKTGVDESLFGIKILPNTNIGFMVGGSGTILKTTDSGASWKRVLSPSRDLLYNLDFSTDKVGFAVGWNGELLKTTDQGLTWNRMDQLSDSYFRGICFVNSNLGVIVGGGGEIFRTDNGGSDWSEISSGTISGLYAVSFVTRNNGFILGSKGDILATVNGGKSWKSNLSGKFGALTQLSVLPSKKVVAVGYGGTILLSQH